MTNINNNSLSNICSEVSLFLPSQIVFIDSGVTDYLALANGVIHGIEVIILDSNQDGIKQISQVLSQNPYSSVHIVSHGSPGCLNLGNSQLRLDTLNQYRKDLEQWFNSSSLIPYPLSLLLYGCNVAAGDAGAEFIAKLNALTGAEIAASTTSIGNAAKGGNWDLDVTTNNTQFPLAFTPKTQQKYAEVFNDISGSVYRDYNLDKTQDAATSGTSGVAGGEPGIADVTVTAYDSAGNSYTTVTDDDGNYTFAAATLGGVGDFRIEFALPTGFEAADSLLRFVNNSSAAVTGIDGLFNRPEQFYSSTNQTNPFIIIPCFVPGAFDNSDTSFNGSSSLNNSGEYVLVAFRYNDSGTTPTPTPIADHGEIGATYGVAYDTVNTNVFVSAYQRSNTSFGPGVIGANTGQGADGAGTIYNISFDSESETFGTATPYVDLNQVFGAGTVLGDNPNDTDGDSNNDYIRDSVGLTQTGKTAFGDLEYYDNNLYTVNLSDKKLYSIPTSGTLDNTTIQGFTIPTPTPVSNSGSGTDTRNSTEIANDMRPFGLGINDGQIYVGIVDSAETSQDRDFLRAYIYTFDPNAGTFGTNPVFDFDLTYTRDDPSAGDATGNEEDWQAWTDNQPGLSLTSGNNLAFAYPQPILSDIEFDNGSLILGIRDRNSDQVGNRVFSPINGGAGTTFETNSAGDILRAAPDGSNGFILESDGVVDDGFGGTLTGSGTNNNGPGGGEFYGEDNFGSIHQETTLGGLLQLPGLPEVVSTVYDPFSVRTGGVAVFSAVDSTTNREYEVYSTADADANDAFGKAAGLGDIQALLDLAPVQVGDRIWNDTDGDGIQDPGEVGISGVTVNLYKDGVLIGTAITATDDGGTDEDETGQYFFGGVDDLNLSGGNTLETNTAYTIEIDTSTATANLPSPANLTLALQGGDREIDSNAIDISGTPTISFTTGDAGENDFSLDAGFTSNVVPAQEFDYGDAPDASANTSSGNYQTRVSDDGAAHLITSDLKLGSEIDADDGTLHKITADADDIDNALNDEDGVTLFPALNTVNSGNTYSVTVNYENSGADATLVGWIDFDGDGNFESSEAQVATVTSANSSQILNWTIPSGVDIQAGNTYARFRISRDVMLVSNYSTGIASDGEVEDYQLFIEGGTDYGDAPDTSLGTGVGNYETLAANNGAAHNIIDGLNLGITIDADDGTLQNINADADNSDLTNDEDGVASFDPLSLSDATLSYSVTVDVNHTTTANANLIGWIDFDGDGNFESGEASNLISGTNIDGSQTLNWTVPSAENIQSGDTYVRLRLSDGTLSNTIPNTLIGNGEVEDYKITIAGGIDYGDAPDDGTNGNYNTTSANSGAAHIIVTGLTIGETIDEDSGTLQDDTANADNSDRLNDEDGITSFATLKTDDSSYSISVPVNNTTGSAATLIGWIDFDGSGTFEADEAVTASVPNGTTTSSPVTLEWNNGDGDANNNIPADIVGGTTFARFRLSTDGNLSTSTPDNSGAFTSGDGEVEDYQLTITQVTDYGDAPDDGGINGDYGTTESNNGAAHGIVDGLNIGGTVDADDGTAEDAAASDDDNTGTDDEEVTIPALDKNADTYSITFPVTNSTSETATLIGWIDFDGSGTFEFDEAVTADVNDGDTSATLTWNNIDGESNNDFPLDITSGITFARFRLSTDSSLTVNTPTGFVFNGEVEDYRITIAGGTDYGDAPDDGGTNGNYVTTSANSGAAHIIVTGLTIGETIDEDSGTLQDDTANADNSDRLNDEDSITSFATLETDDSSYSISVPVNNTTGSAATLIGWIDFDGSGTFEADEAVTASVPNGTTTSSPINLEWNNSDGDGNNDIPADIVGGTTYARFRLSTDPNLSTSTPDNSGAFTSGDGEVEDYQLTITQVTDYGDAPDDGGVNGNYGTTEANSGAAHGIVDGLNIGASVDADDGTQQNSDATADDNLVLNTLSYQYYDLTVRPNSVSEIPTSGADVEGILDPDLNLVTQADRGDTEDFGIRYTGFIFIETAGEYTFFTTSDDGSTLSIDGTQVVDNDGQHGSRERQGNFTFLEPGNYPIEIEFFEASGGQNLSIAYKSTDAGVSKQNIPGSILSGSIDDEDGTSSLSVLDSDTDTYSITLPITNSTGETATLIGWIDFDGSGTFESDEAVTAEVADGASSATLSWDNTDGSTDNDIPDDITDGTTYARFRLSTDSSLTTSTPTGFVTNGEVEDYQITINGIDYGDAPDTGTGFGAGNYQTTSSDNGAAHIITGTLALGTSVDVVDADKGTQQNTAANADDVSDGNDDEAGITSFATLDVNDANLGTYSYTVNVDVANNTGGNVTLIGWIDFDGSGTFDSDESVIVNNIADNGGTATSVPVTWDNTDNATNNENNIPSGLTSGTTYARFRVSSDFNSITDRSGVDANTPLGLVNDGEVEDYAITIEGGTDYGDAPDTGAGTGTGNYETLDANSGASHTIVSGFSIGATVDSEDGTLQNATADADDSAGTNDEDGVTFVDSTVISTSDTSYSVEVIVNAPSGSSDTTLVGWIDLNRDGSFDSGESQTLNIAGGLNTDGVTPNTLTWDGGGSSLVPGGTTTGDTYARFRLMSTTIFSENFDSYTSFDEGTTGWESDPGGSDTAVNADSGAWEIGDSNNVDRDTGTEIITAELDAFSASNALITGLDTTSTAASNNHDVNVDPLETETNGITTIDSPDFTLPTAASAIDLSLQYFLTTNSANDDNFTIELRRSSDDFLLGASPLLDETPSAAQNGSWTAFNASLLAYAGETAYLRFIATDSNDDTILEVGVDDIEITFTPDSTGAAFDGEVEDYLLSIKNEVPGTESPETLAGGANDDLIIGGKGEDTLTGGAGNDCFYFNETSDGIDTITDFTVGEDKIDLSAILADEVTAYTSGDPFTQGYVELAEITLGGTTSTIVQIDFDAGDETLSSDLYHKDIALLEGVALNTLDTSRDFII